MSELPRVVQHWPRWIHATLFAAGLALSFPFRAGGVQVDVGIVAGWLALVPLVWMLHGLSPRAAFVWAGAASSAAFAVILFWIYVVVNTHGGAPAPLAAVAVVLISGYVGLHIGAAGAASAWLSRGLGTLGGWVLPAAWVVAEHLRTLGVFNGFPWAFLGYSMHADGPMLELASLGGVWGLSFLLAGFAALIARGHASWGALLLVVAHVAGFGLRLAQVPAAKASDPPLRVALVQANIPQSVKWDAERASRNFEAHLETTRLGASQGVDLVLWPESAITVFVEAQTGFAGQLEALARETGATIIAGGIGLNWPDGATGSPQASNSVFVVTPRDGFVDRYDKTVLAPFGEYIPFRAVLNFLSWLAPGLAGGSDLMTGPAPRVLRNLPENLADHAPSALICYEVIYPGLVREAVQDGARVLLNLTNDAWYGHSSAPHQFMAIAAMRSAEHGLPMLRAANTGVSGVVDAGGAVLQNTPIFERWALPVELPPAREGPTLYTMWGDWVVWVCWMFLIALGAMTLGGTRIRGVRVVGNDESGEGNQGRSRSSGQTRR